MAYLSIGKMLHQVKHTDSGSAHSMTGRGNEAEP